MAIGGGWDQRLNVPAELTLESAIKSPLIYLFPSLISQLGQWFSASKLRTKQAS